MAANWAIIITGAVLFCFAVYIGFLIGQEVGKRYTITKKEYWLANGAGLFVAVLLVALIPFMAVQVSILGLVAGFIAGLKMSFGESAGPWKWLDRFMNINRKHRDTAAQGSGEARRQRRKTGEAAPDVISVDSQGSSTSPDVLERK